jgi:catechol 2,3-dioxygenase-like lactoylglutathione lyase family enzyme
LLYTFRSKALQEQVNSSEDFRVPGGGSEMSSWVNGISAITLFTADLEQTKEFYRKVFDLPVAFANEDSAVFNFGNMTINLLAVSSADELIEPARVAAPDAGSRHVFTIEVEDVDAMCAELASLGVELLSGPMDRPWGIRTASFTDPAGQIWEIAK